MKVLKNQQSLYLFTLLVAADLAFIVLGIVYVCGFIKLTDFCVALNLDEHFAVTRDRGYAEAFQYIKEYWLVILFSFLAMKQNIKIYLGWVFLSAYLLVDDSLSFHERAGEVIAEKLNFASLFGLRPVDFGEIIVFATVGITFFLWLSTSYKIANRKERKVFKALIVLLFCLAGFAIVVDLIHVMLEDSVFWNAFLGIMEDGGEQIVMSLILSFVWSIATESTQKININKTKREQEIAYTRR